jgi:hypothetical protein
MAISLDQLHGHSYERDAASELRLLYQLYEEAQRTRIAHGERLRAIFQGRSSSSGVPSTDEDVDGLLKGIARGQHASTPRILENAYTRSVEDEAAAAAALRETIELHPAWPWLENVRGIGHLLAARLLSRLDVARAHTPSAFWAYCGLGTIPGVAYHCSKCGLEVAYPVGYKVGESHYARAATRECSGKLQAIAPTIEIRVAPRKSALGGRASYDAHARKSCYLIGVSILRSGGGYRSFYDSERARLASSRAGWTAKRCHLSALRRMEKAFLRDLWIAWRRAANLPVVSSYFPRIE